MRMEMKFIFIIFCLLEAKSTRWENFFLKTIFNILFPKDLGIMRVRKPEEVNITMDNAHTLDFIGLVERYGYSAEEHYVTTEDGYNLVIHRISGSPLFKGRQRKNVVFLQNGLLGSSDCWVLIGAGKDLAFLLADEGYDVWLGNYRGNTYCRSHVKLSPRNKDFWQFSYHEIGTRDLPAMIDYILNNTKQKTLRYIGISMGTTELFILLSVRPEYNAKIKLGICFAPIAIWKEIPPLLKFVYNNFNITKVKDFFDSNEIHEIIPLSSTSIMMARTLCADKTITQAVCTALIFLISGYNPTQLNTTAIPEVLSNAPTGTSVQILHHYYQNMITKKFQAYDYGYFGNYEKYRQITPITYNLSKITAPLAIFYGANDLLALEPNVFETSRHLPNVILLEEITHKLFTHLDFLFAIDVKTLVYDRVIKLLQEFDNRAKTSMIYV